MPAPENILLIRLKSIGDVIFTLPAVHAVRENFPDAKLHFLVSKEHAPLVRGFADVDEIIPLDREAFRSRNPIAICASAFKLVRDLRGKKISRVIDFQGYGETAWLSWLTGAPERWGRAQRYARSWAYTRAIERDDNLQIADWNLSLVRQCGLQISRIRNHYVLPAESLAEARKFFLANGLSENKLTLFIQPFTSSQRKNWPLENFLKLAAHFQSQNMQVIFGGGPNDSAALEPARAAGFAVAAGTPLLVSAGLMKLSTLTVGGITGLLHLAVAMQKRVVMLVGYPAREPGFPYQHKDWAVTPPDGGNVSGIEISAVVDACVRALEELRLPLSRIESSDKIN